MLCGIGCAVGYAIRPGFGDSGGVCGQRVPRCVGEASCSITRGFVSLRLRTGSVVTAMGLCFMLEAGTSSNFVLSKAYEVELGQRLSL